MRYLLLFSLTLALNVATAQDTVTVENVSYNAGDTLGIYYISIAVCIHPAPSSEFDYIDQSPLDSLVDILLTNKTVHVRMEVHTDTRGSQDKNKELTQGRADLFKRYVISQGVNASRIEAIGYGEDQPIFEEKYINQFRKTNREKFERLHQRNRRTLFIVTEN